jgi:hypothetical protein
MKKKTSDLKNGSWTSSQWYSDQRIDNAPRYWNTGDLATHLAYITEQEIQLLKKQGQKTGKPLTERQGPSGLPFFATADVRVSNTKGSEDSAKNVPAKWKSSKDHPIARLVYVTDEQAQFLKKMDIHDSGVDKHEHYGPENVPSYQGDGGGGDSGGSDSGSSGSDSSSSSSDYSGTSSDTGVGNPGESDNTSANTGFGNPSESAADYAAAAYAAEIANSNALASDLAAIEATYADIPDYNFDSPVGFVDPGPAPVSNEGDFTGLAAAIAAQEAAPAPSLSPAQAQAALNDAVFSNVVASQDFAAPVGPIGYNGMYNAELSYDTLQTLANLGFRDMDVPGNPGQTIAQALAANDLHGYLNENVGSVMGFVGGPVMGLVATIGSQLGQGRNPMDVAQSALSSIFGTAISNAIGLPVSGTTISSLVNGDYGKAAQNFVTGVIAETTGLNPSAINAAISGNVGAAVSNIATGSLIGNAAQASGAGPLGGLALSQVASATGFPSDLAALINDSPLGQAVNAAVNSISSSFPSGDARSLGAGTGAISAGLTPPSVSSGSERGGESEYLDPLGAGLASIAPVSSSGRRKKYDYLSNLNRDVIASLSSTPRSSVSSVTSGTQDAGTSVFIEAKKAGATDEEALAAANSIDVVVGDAIPPRVDTGVELGQLEPVETSRNASVERLADEYAKSLGKTLGTLSAGEVDNFANKISAAINSGGVSALQKASIQDILSGNFASTPTNEEGFRYDERGIPILRISGVGEDQKTDVGTTASTNIANAIVESVGGLEGTGSDVAKQGLSTLLSAVGEQIADFSTGLGNMGLVSRQNAGVSAGEYLQGIAQRLELPETRQAINNWVKGVSDEPTYYGKLSAGVKGVFENPLILTEVAKEGIQEILPIGVAAKIVKFAGIGAAAVADTLLNSIESAGSTGRQIYAQEIANGKSPAEAARIADRSAGAAGFITMATSGIVDAAVAKKYGKAIEDYFGRKTASTGKEFGQESVEEGLIALALGDSVADALTKSVVGGLVGAKTSGSIQTAADVKNDLTASFASQGLASTDGSFKPETIVPLGSEAGGVQTVADSAVGDTTQGQNVTGVDTPQTVDKDTNIVTTVDGNTTTVVDANSNVTTQTTVDPTSKTQTTVVVDANANTNTQTVFNPNTNTTTSTTVDTNSKVTTQTTIDSNTQVTVMTDTNADTQTTVKVNIDTGEVIDVKETKIPSDWKQPVIDLPKTQVTPTQPVAQPDSVAQPASVSSPTLTASTTSSATGLMAPGKGLGSPLTIDASGKPLKSFETQKAIDPLARVKEAQAELERDVMMNQIDPRLMNVMQQRMDPQQQTKQFETDIGALSKLLRGETPTPTSDGKYYSYGSEDSIDSILGAEAKAFKEGGFVEPLKASGGMVLPILAKSGGALSDYGGRENYKGGKHVAGKGDGQSDDIPAWLADGEFVFPADVVSALGNGSTKAGTDKLYSMMHGIRDRARSKGPKDLPSPALKSPLDYLKSSKRSTT